jgi:hypothetical protein
MGFVDRVPYDAPHDIFPGLTLPVALLRGVLGVNVTPGGGPVSGSGADDIYSLASNAADAPVSV